MKLIIGPASIDLGNRIAQLLNIQPIQTFYKTFPDGESYIRIEDVAKDENVVIVQTTSPPQDSRLIQLAFMADAAKRNNAKNVIAVVPYLAYARQDKIFLQGETVSIETIATMLKAAGVDKLITVNVHQAKALERFPFPAKSLSAIPLLAEHFKKIGLNEAFALAPDKGAIHIAEEAAKVLGGEYGYLEKQRDRYTGQITVEKKTFNIKGKPTIIFDDIISTGGTIVAAAKILKDLGANSVYASCVHPLLVGDAEKRIRQAGVEEIIGTDSVSTHVSKVSLAPLICRELKELKSG